MVITTRNGTPFDKNNILRVLKDISAKANVKYITFHGLRHTVATLLLSNNTNSKDVSDLLGHSNVKITLDTYYHVANASRIQTVINLKNIIFGT